MWSIQPGGWHFPTPSPRNLDPTLFFFGLRGWGWGLFIINPKTAAGISQRLCHPACGVCGRLLEKHFRHFPRQFAKLLRCTAARFLFLVLFLFLFFLRAFPAFNSLPLFLPFAFSFPCPCKKREKWALQQLLQNLQRFAEREMQFGRTDGKTVARSLSGFQFHVRKLRGQTLEIVSPWGVRWVRISRIISFDSLHFHTLFDTTSRSGTKTELFSTGNKTAIFLKQLTNIQS